MLITLIQSGQVGVIRFSGLRGPNPTRAASARHATYISAATLHYERNTPGPFAGEHHRQDCDGHPVLFGAAAYPADRSQANRELARSRSRNGRRDNGSHCRCTATSYRMNRVVAMACAWRYTEDSSNSVLIISDDRLGSSFRTFFLPPTSGPPSTFLISVRQHLGRTPSSVPPWTRNIVQASTAASTEVLRHGQFIKAESRSAQSEPLWAQSKLRGTTDFGTVDRQVARQRVREAEVRDQRAVRGPC